MTIEPRIIKTEEQYRRYLDEVARLAANDPDADTNDGARLELLAKLVEDYEKFAASSPKSSGPDVARAGQLAEDALAVAAPSGTDQVAGLLAGISAWLRSHPFDERSA